MMVIAAGICGIPLYRADPEPSLWLAPSVTEWPSGSVHILSLGSHTAGEVWPIIRSLSVWKVDHLWNVHSAHASSP
jgi:hypothetical protein